MALGETEVVHGDIGAGQNHRHHIVALLPLPQVALGVDKGVGDALKGNFGVEHLLSVHAHRGLSLVLYGGELAHCLGKGLCLQVVYLPPAEGIGAAREGRGGTNLLVDNQIVALHEAVARGEDWNDVAIELIAQQHDEHAEKIGEEEAGKLRHADMLAQ